MNEFEKYIKTAIQEYWRDHKRFPCNPDALAERAAKEGVKPENFGKWTDGIERDHSGAMIPRPPIGANGKERHLIANGGKPSPDANPNPKPSPVHPSTGRSSWDVIEKQKAEAAAKKEKQRKTRNPFLASHLSNADDTE